MFTREYAFEVFRLATEQVWHNHQFVQPVLVLSDEPPAGDVLASLAYAGKPMAIGNSILRRAERYILRVSDRLLAMDAEHVRRVMIHEAVHLGYPKHDANFRQLVREHGGTQSESALDNPGVHVQVKQGSRYTTIKTFEDEREATRWAKEQMRANPGRYRLSLGDAWYSL